MYKTLSLATISIVMLLGFSYGRALAIEPVASDNLAGLVDCGKLTTDNSDDPSKTQNECGFNDLVVLFQKIIRFTIFNIVIPLVTLIIFYYGIMLVISGDKPAKLTELKKSLWKVMIGLFFMLTAWLIVEGIVRVFRINLQDPNAGGRIENGPIKLINFN